jgi:hypothetical protein
MLGAGPDTGASGLEAEAPAADVVRCWDDTLPAGSNAGGVTAKLHEPEMVVQVAPEMFTPGMRDWLSSEAASVQRSYTHCGQLNFSRVHLPATDAHPKPVTTMQIQHRCTKVLALTLCSKQLDVQLKTSIATGAGGASSSAGVQLMKAFTTCLNEGTGIAYAGRTLFAVDRETKRTTAASTITAQTIDMSTIATLLTLDQMGQAAFAHAWCRILTTDPETGEDRLLQAPGSNHPTHTKQALLNFLKVYGRSRAAVRFRPVCIVYLNSLTRLYSALTSASAGWAQNSTTLCLAAALSLCRATKHAEATNQPAPRASPALVQRIAEDSGDQASTSVRMQPFGVRSHLRYAA